MKLIISGLSLVGAAVAHSVSHMNVSTRASSSTDSRYNPIAPTSAPTIYSYNNNHTGVIITVTVTSTKVCFKRSFFSLSLDWRFHLTQVLPTTITKWNTVTETDENAKSVTQTKTSILSTEIINNTQTLEHTLTATETQTQTNNYTQTATKTDTATATIQETTTDFATVTQLSTVVQPTTFTSIWVSTQVMNDVSF